MGGDGTGFAEALLGLDGFRVLGVGDLDGGVVVLIETTAERVGCPGCGVVADAQDRMEVEIRDRPPSIGGVKWDAPHAAMIRARSPTHSRRAIKLHRTTLRTTSFALVRDCTERHLGSSSQRLRRCAVAFSEDDCTTVADVRAAEDGQGGGAPGRRLEKFLSLRIGRYRHNGEMSVGRPEPSASWRARREVIRPSRPAYVVV